MINPFLLSPNGRLDHWKTFRRSLPALADPEQLDAVVRYFAHAPLRNIAYDIDAPKTWPTMWEMIRAGDWCRNSIAIGMEATLRLSGWESSRLDLRYVVHQAESIAALVVFIDRQQLLNYEWATVTPRPNGLRTLNRYYWDGRAYSTVNASAVLAAAK